MESKQKSSSHSDYMSGHCAIRHWPGPYEVVGTKICTVANDRERIAIARMERLGEETTDATAALFAAAPDMLAALRAILFQVCQGKVLDRDACISQARAAIAKAEGRS